jgi:hypothetical protein
MKERLTEDEVGDVVEAYAAMLEVLLNGYACVLIPGGKVMVVDTDSHDVVCEALVVKPSDLPAALNKVADSLEVQLQLADEYGQLMAVKMSERTSAAQMVWAAAVMAGGMDPVGNES